MIGSLVVVVFIFKTSALVQPTISGGSIIFVPCCIAGNSSFWESGANRAIGGAPSNWNSKPSVSWTGGDNTTGSSGWGPSPGGSSGQHGWGDSSGGSQWQGGAGNRKPSFGWDDGQMNGGEYVRDRRLVSL